MRSGSLVTESPCWPGRPTPTLVAWRHQDPIVLTYHNSVRLLGTPPCRSPMTVDIPEPEERIAITIPAPTRRQIERRTWARESDFANLKVSARPGRRLQFAEQVPKDGSGFGLHRFGSHSSDTGRVGESGRLEKESILMGIDAGPDPEPAVVTLQHTVPPTENDSTPQELNRLSGRGTMAHTDRPGAGNGVNVTRQVRPMRLAR